MVVISMPKWTVELDDKLTKVIKDIALKHDIPLAFVEDSMTIDKAKRNIVNTMWGIDERVDVEKRRELKKWKKENGKRV